jgi:hypothetical protein
VSTSLNDLNYDFPQGFARFVLSTFEPHISDSGDWRVRELEEIVGLQAAQDLGAHVRSC